MPRRPFPLLALAAGVLWSAAASAQVPRTEPVTLVFHDVPTRLALAAIADLEDVDFVAGSALQDEHTSIAATLPIDDVFMRIAHDAGAQVRVLPGGVRAVAPACALARELAPIRVPGDWHRGAFNLPGVDRRAVLSMLADQTRQPLAQPDWKVGGPVVAVRTGQLEAGQVLRALQVVEGLEPADDATSRFDLRPTAGPTCPAGAPRPPIDRTKRPLTDYPAASLRMAGYLQRGDANPLAFVLAPNDVLYAVHVGDALGAEGATVRAIYGDGIHQAGGDGLAVDTPLLPFAGPRFGLQRPLAEVRRDAERGDARAQALLGAMLSRGNGVPRDLPAGAAWLARAAEQGDAAAQDSLAIDYDLGAGVAKDPAQGLAWHRRAAAQGLTVAELQLGLALWLGDGVPADAAAAAAWLRRAAEHGDPLAQESLAWLLLDSPPPVGDPVDGLRWLRRAADNGVTRAQARLGDVYANGRLMRRDDAQAIEWYQRAMSRSSADAEYGLASLYYRRPPDAQDDARAVTLLSGLARRDARAQLGLAAFALDGRGGPVDRPAAARWLEAAAAQGLPTARELLGTLLLDDPSLRDPVRAMKWLRAAAEGTPGVQTPQQRERYTVPPSPRGDARSQRVLAERLIASDPVEALQWLVIAQANGDVEAAANVDGLRRRMTAAQVEAGERRAREWLAARPAAR